MVQVAAEVQGAEEEARSIPVRLQEGQERGCKVNMVAKYKGGKNNG